MTNQWYEFLESQGAETIKGSVTAFQNHSHPISELAELNTICDLSHYGLLKITGPDASKFLQGQLTCDVTKVTNLSSRLGCYCNPQGKVIASFLIFLVNNAYFLFLPKSMVVILQSALQKYSVFSKVTVAPDNEFIMIGLTGTAIATFVSRSNYEVPAEITGVSQTRGLTCIKFPGLYPRFACIATFATIKSLWLELIRDLIPSTDTVWHYNDILSGIANIYPESQSQFLPHRINYHLINAVDFKKGCYVGQEVIARLHYRGILKHHMYLYEVTNALSLLPGLAVSSSDQNTIVGYIIDAIEVDPQQWIALIIMQIDYCEDEEALINDRVLIKRLTLPYSLEDN